MDGFLRSQLLKYRHAEMCRQDVSRALQQYKSLRPNLQKFIHNDGRETDLLAMEGTVPVQYRGVTYHIPVCVWLQENHPYQPPLVFVKPTSTMAIRASKHVDSNGRVYHPYLHEWNYPKSDLAALLQLLCCIFAEQPPVYARPEAGPTANYNRPPVQPQPGYPPAQYGAYTTNPPGTTPYPVRGPSRMPMPVPMPMPGSSPVGPGRPGGPVGPGRPGGPGGPGRPGGPGHPPYPAYHPPSGGAPPKPPYPVSTQPGYPPNTQSSYPPVPSSYPPVTQANLVTTAPSKPAATPPSDLLPSTVRASLMTAVEDKLKRRTRALFEQAQSELEELNKTQMELKKGSEKLEDILKRLEREQECVDNDIKMLTQKNEEIEDVITKLEGADKLDIDEAVVTTTPLYNQILNLFAEENAVEDTIYYLSESLRKEAIDLEIFLKHVRALSRKQFMLRALLYKARKTAGLSEVAGS